MKEPHNHGPTVKDTRTDRQNKSGKSNAVKKGGGGAHSWGKPGDEAGQQVQEDPNDPNFEEEEEQEEQ